MFRSTLPHGERHHVGRNRLGEFQIGFRSTLPHGEGDPAKAPSTAGRAPGRFRSTLPHGESDLSPRAVCSQSARFRSTPPRGERRRGAARGEALRSVSIHAPPGRATVRPGDGQAVSQGFDPRPPGESRLEIFSRHVVLIKSFDPRPPRGERRASREGKISQSSRFDPRPPGESDTLVALYMSMGYTGFDPRPPGESDAIRLNLENAGTVSIHAPPGRATAVVTANL